MNIATTTVEKCMNIATTKVEKCVNIATTNVLSKKLFKKMLADRPKSESDLDISGGPKFLDSDLHL